MPVVDSQACMSHIKQMVTGVFLPNPAKLSYFRSRCVAIVRNVVPNILQHIMTDRSITLHLFPFKFRLFRGFCVYVTIRPISVSLFVTRHVVMFMCSFAPGSLSRHVRS